ncbi:MAG TPA: hypothetical protein EYG85_03590 [Crocinitomix sp.]|nr:hypothetical protein [Crocinitomix sp.]
MQVDFTLSFTDNQWICYNDTIEVQGDSLDEIDENLAMIFKSKYKNEPVNVTMLFDFDYFPQWHRQYMSHYFNRNLTFNLNS